MKKLTLSGSIFTVLLCSCTHYYYVPNVQNVPLFRETNEFKFSGSVGGGDESTCIEGQLAYALSGNIGIMTNFMYASGGDKAKDNFSDGNYFEGAAGYFKPYSNKTVFEIYGGIGGSSQQHQYNSSGVTSKLTFTKFFIQPSYGLTSNAFDVALSTRLCALSYNRIEKSSYLGTLEYDILNNLSGGSHYFVEPAITVRAGWKNVKVQSQFIYSAYLNDPELYFNEEWHFTFGVCFVIADRYMKTPPKDL